MAVTYRARSSFLVIVLVTIFALCIGLLPASAQGITPLNPGQNVQGQLTTAAPVASFAVSIGQPQIMLVQVLAIDTGLVPTLQVVDPGGTVTQSFTATGPILPQTSLILSPGTYLLNVGSASASLGNFLISLIAGPAIPPPVPLQLGLAVNESVSTQQPVRLYNFQGTVTDTLVLSMNTAPGTLGGPTVRIRNAQTQEVLAQTNAQFLGSRLRIGPGQIAYVVEVTHAGTSPNIAYTLCLELDNGSTPCGGGAQVVIPPIATQVVLQPTGIPQQPTVAPTQFIPVSIPPNGPCAVASSSGATVNIRSGPSTNFPVVTQLPNNQIALVLARLPDNSWYQVNFNGVIGWISGSVIVIGGQCGSISPVTLTPTPPGATAIPTLTPTPSITPTTAVTATNTPTNTPSPEPVPTLNFSLPPVYGSTSLTSGFVPDPFTVGITGGGPASAGYLGSGCTGFMTSAPSFSVNYTSGAFPTLRFYFIGSGDTTMVINGPSGSYFCNDDSFGTLNPTIDFNSPSSGRYDIWIGTFSSGGAVGGTLYVTENTGNHP